jgi:hypothetical protein
MAFDSFATNEYGIYFGPTALSPDHSKRLTTLLWKIAFPRSLQIKLETIPGINICLTFKGEIM